MWCSHFIPCWCPGQVTVLAVPISTAQPSPQRVPTHTRAAPVATTSGPHATPGASSALRVRVAGIFTSHLQFSQFLCLHEGEGKVLDSRLSY